MRQAGNDVGRPDVERRQPEGPFQKAEWRYLHDSEILPRGFYGWRCIFTHASLVPMTIDDDNAALSGRGFVPTSDVVVTDLDDDLVLLDPKSGEMFALNESGRCVWHALDQGLDAAAAALVDAFDVPPERAHADVRALVAELVAAGLVSANGTGA